MILDWKNSSINKSIAYSCIKFHVNATYPSFKVTYNSRMIEIEGRVNDCDWINSYQIKIFYVVGGEPLVKIISPKITPCASIHMYSDYSLCLYHPNDIPYLHKFSIAYDILPWTFKWFHYYEIWLRNGNRWIGPETPHT